MPSATTGDKRWLWKLWKTWGLLGVALLLVGPASAGEDRDSQPREETLEDLPKLDPDYQMNTHKVVLITADSLNPTTVNLDPGQLIAWISYSPSKSTVVFERSVARSMVCHSRVNFSFEEGELRLRLLPAFKHSRDSVKVPFFQKLLELSEEAPKTGAVVLTRSRLQVFLVGCLRQKYRA